MSTLPQLAEHYDVAVIGVGPVGALAANLLAREGLRVLAIDRAPAVYDLPRAIGMDHESLRLLQPLGVPERMGPHLGGYRASEYRSAGGAVLRRIVQPPEPYPLSWPPYVTFIQPELERALREAMAADARVDLRLGVQATLLAHDDTGARLKLSEAATGATREVAARAVVACDGASSPTREQLGIALEDLVFDEPWLVVDVLVDDPSTLPEVNIQTCDPARPSTYVCGPGNLRRWEVMLLPDEVPAEMAQEDSVWRLLSGWLTPAQGRIWRAATYRFHALVAERWRDGCVFLVGDAAHQTPPFMAQGLNQGIRDAGNICWKLAEVLRGRASDALLDSYEAERRPFTRAVIEITKTLGRLICERDADRAAARDAAMLAEMEAGKGVLVRQDLLPQALLDGFLLRDADGAPAPGSGRVFPQPWLRLDDGPRRMDDVIGARWLLVGQPGWRPDDALVREAAAMGVTLAALGTSEAPVHGLVEQDRLIADWLAQFGADAVLVRPDHVTFGIARGAAAADKLLAAARRALSA